MMKISLLIIGSVLTLSIRCSGQDHSGIPIKEQYDNIIESIVSKASIENLVADNNNGNFLGDRVSYFLKSLLTMYNTTGDKGYLIRFISFSYIIQNVRNDMINSANHPGWVENSNSNMYQDGLIIMPMAEFVYIVSTDNILSNTPLPSSTTLGIDLAYFPSFSTYGAYATWLRNRVDQTLYYYTYNPGYWGDDSRCYTPVPNPNSNTQAQQMNQQVGFACTLFYLGMTDPNTYYQHKAAMIANAYKGNVTDDICTYYLGGWHDIGDITRPVLGLDTNNAYIWKSKGWQTNSCNDQYGEQPDDYEDLAHGLQTLLFPLTVCNKYIPNEGIPFTNNDMIRFRNTFTENIVGGYNNLCPDIHAAVDGDDFISYRTENNFDYNGLNNAIMIQSALGWMPLYKFDDLSSHQQYRVYDVIMDLYKCRFQNSISNLYHSNGYYGLSEVVSAQWDKECVSLTLFNRHVVYDQDFTVKNILYVSPADATGDSYADPIISEKVFYNDPGISMTMTAGNAIELNPGFEGNPGFEAYIDPSLNCSMSLKSTGHGNRDISEGTNNKPVEQIMMPERKFVIYPNPNNGSFTVDVPGAENLFSSVIFIRR